MSTPGSSDHVKKLIEIDFSGRFDELHVEVFGSSLQQKCAELEDSTVDGL